MKIAIFHNLPSGGAKRTLYESMRRLALQHRLDVYTLSTADRDFCSLSDFTTAEYVYQFSPSKIFKSPFGRINQALRSMDLQRLDRLSRRISKDIDSRKYDVVFAQPCMWTQAPLLLRHLRTPSIYYCHEPPRHLYETVFGVANSDPNLRRTLNRIDPLIWLYRMIGRRYDKLAVRAASLVLVNSIFIRERVKQIYGIDAVVSYHGVDTSVFSPDLDASKEEYVLSVGAIQPHKGFDFLIESISHLDRKIRPSLCLVGNMKNSQDQESLQALARTKDVDLNIEVGVDQNTLIRRYNESVFVAYAPYNEPFGLVPLEAMACGKAVVGIHEGGVSETVVDGKTGILVERDSRKFGLAIQSLLENPDLMETYGRNGRAHVVENWTWERSVSVLESHLVNCASVGVYRNQSAVEQMS